MMKNSQTIKAIFTMLTILLLAGCGNDAYHQAQDDLEKQEAAKAKVSALTPPQTPDTVQPVNLPGVGRK